MRELGRSGAFRQHAGQGLRLAAPEAQPPPPGADRRATSFAFARRPDVPSAISKPKFDEALSLAPGKRGDLREPVQVAELVVLFAA